MKRIDADAVKIAIGCHNKTVDLIEEAKSITWPRGDAALEQLFELLHEARLALSRTERACLKELHRRWDSSGADVFYLRRAQNMGA